MRHLTTSFQAVDVKCENGCIIPFCQCRGANDFVIVTQMNSSASPLPSLDDGLAINRRAWDIVAPLFAGCCALPDWGPFGEGRHLDMLGPLESLTIMEIGCGSGHSIAHLAERGAARIIGVDLSRTQIALAGALNRAQIESGRVQLIEAPMETRLDLQGVDLVFSVQALGWTLDPAATFANIASYLKPGGRLVWSWGHPLFGKIAHENGRLVLSGSYFDEQPQLAPGWCGSDGALMQPRTVATWFRHLTDAGFTVHSYLELEAQTFPEAAADPSRFYSRVKAEAIPCTIAFVCERA